MRAPTVVGVERQIRHEMKGLDVRSRVRALQRALGPEPASDPGGRIRVLTELRATVPAVAAVLSPADLALAEGDPVRAAELLATEALQATTGATLDAILSRAEQAGIGWRDIHAILDQDTARHVGGRRGHLSLESLIGVCRGNVTKHGRSLAASVAQYQAGE